MEALVTYELVANAAEKLLATQKKVTVLNLREALGNKGSIQTIHKYYKLWKVLSQS